ncbi:hypothetical protein CAPTEDRAFT_196478 [Capitella teleta]|uniref:VWFA domain-containing protein n=1 Tax=Capitella teleta TaxID=283909 RepID=R7UG60_CAPTE|nr:hypothetical protein CAPTEDRAFT_196478 [Capitella teleta]|eukprot:ELU05048.1 hypothetical protein CAPTEDRAFT_196478 [Capitella teleta]
METFGTSDYRLEATDKTTLFADNPFTLRLVGCGIPGKWTHLTDGFFLNDSIPLYMGALEKVLVHEWGHLRFGVFDEYPLSPNQNFYVTSAGMVESSRCSLANTGSIYTPSTGAAGCSETGSLPWESCEFKDDEITGTGYGSLMYRQFLPQITEFCDDDPNNAKTKHNPDAVTQHNTQCNGRSVWDVINSHEDFRNVNPAVNISDTKPVFRFVRARSARVVLVLDVSGSMGGQKLEKLQQGCYQFISSIASGCTSVGIVTFTSSGRTNHEIVKINPASRLELIGAIPPYANGGTDIGAGLWKALDELQAYGDPEGGNIILVSDGEAPSFDAAADNLKSAGIIVHSIAITNAADSNIDGVARESGGMSFLFAPGDSSGSLYGAFQEIGNNIGSECVDEDKSIKVHHGSLSTTSNNRGQFFISQDVSKDTRVIFEYQTSSNIEFYLESNSGQQYGPESTEYSCRSQLNICIFEFSSIQTGMWTYALRTADGSSASASVTVVGKNPSTTIKAIEAEVYWHLSAIDDIDVGTETIQTIHATVSQAQCASGYSPVVHANVTVNVERPGNDGPVTLALLDNGAGQGKKIELPAQIKDLRVTDFSYNDRSVTLTWTAVGAELDTGTASQYEIRYANDSTSLRSSFDQQRIVVQDMIVNGADPNKPRDAGQTEVFIIVLPEGDRIFYVAVVAIDNNRTENATSPVSNVVSIPLVRLSAMAPENTTKTGWVGLIVFHGSNAIMTSLGLGVIFIVIVVYLNVKGHLPCNAL